jgi:long-chain acyl-CoA synthetase
MEQHFWQKSYQEGVAHNIDPTKYHSVVEMFEESFEKFKDRPAFHNMGKTLKFSELDKLSLSFASYLQNDLELSPGDSIALMMPNILQYPICLFGALRAGLKVVNVNPLYTARELEHQLNDSEAKAIVIFANSASTLQEILPKTSIEHVIVTQIGDFLAFPKSKLVNFVLKNVKKMVPKYHIKTAVNLKHALKKGKPKNFTRPKLKHNDIAFLQYTGGTTGVAKGAVLTHGNIVANILQATEWISPSFEETNTSKDQEIIITPLPLYHIFSLTANCFTFSNIGALNILITNPRDMNGFIKELKKWPFTAITGVNTLFNGLINNEGFKSVDFSHLRLALGGGMAVQRPVAEKWMQVSNH